MRFFWIDDGERQNQGISHVHPFPILPVNCPHFWSLPLQLLYKMDKPLDLVEAHFQVRADAGRIIQPGI